MVEEKRKKMGNSFLCEGKQRVKLDPRRKHQKRSREGKGKNFGWQGGDECYVPDSRYGEHESLDKLGLDAVARG